jgi:DNA invertase Pin-like site-specific DNA recombinase
VAAVMVAVYIRLSNDDTKKRGDSIETQRNIILNFIEEQPDMQVYDFYIDNGTTGQNFERPAFGRMLADMEAGNVNCVIVKDLSRFGRNAIDTGYYMEKLLPSIKVRLIAVTDDYDSQNPQPGSGILFPLKNMINEAYALDIGRKVKAVHDQNMKDGLFIGSHAPYGYKKSPTDCHRLIVNGDTAPVVRQIFAWAMDGLNVTEITRALNDSGIITPSVYKQSIGEYKHPTLVGRGHWLCVTVRNILCDHVYMGDLVQGKTNKTDRRQKELDPAKWIEVRNTHAPIISRADFETAQRVLTEAAQAETVKRSPVLPYTGSLFKGKVMCAHCGYVMHRHRTTSTHFVTYWFNCQTQTKISKAACVQVSVKEDDLKATVLTLLQKYAHVFTGSYINLKNKTMPEEKASMDAELRSIRLERDKSEGFLKSLYENLVSGLITAEEYGDMKAEYNAKIAALTDRANELRNRKRFLEDKLSEYKSLSDAVAGLTCEHDLTAALIERTVDKILVYHDKSIEIRWTFTEESYFERGLALCSNM